jgi:hypothetical protein
MILLPGFGAPKFADAQPPGDLGFVHAGQI